MTRFLRQLEVIGSIQNSRTDFNEYRGYVWSGDFEPMVQETFKLSDYAAAFELMAGRSLLGKVVLVRLGSDSWPFGPA